MAFDQNISWFQDKLGKYDKASWERSFEEREQEKGLNYVTKKLGGLKPELIDVDLVIGSTFPKTKPMYSWFAITRKGLFHTIFFPLYLQWWIQQTSHKLTILFLFLYVFEIINLVIYFSGWISESKVVSGSEAWAPALVMVLLGTLFMHMVSTDYCRGSHRRRDKNARRRRTLVRQKRKSDDGSHESETSGKDDVANGKIEDIPVFFNGDDGIKHRRTSYNTKRVSDTDRQACAAADATFNGYNESEKSEEEVSDSGDSTGSTTESDEMDEVDMDSVNCEEDPFAFGKQNGISTGVESPAIEQNVMVSVWEGNQCKKASLTLLEISAAIVKRVDTHKGNTGYLHFSFCVSLLLAATPFLFRFYIYRGNISALALSSWDGITELVCLIFGYHAWSRFIVFVSLTERLVLSVLFFSLLCVAERSYRQRCLYAKLFGWLTSSRKARRAGLPHFRLHKVRNIKTWLSLRSLLKKRGPQRSVDMIVSSTFVLGVVLVIIMCVQLIKGNEKNRFMSSLFNWEVSIWCLVLSVFVLRFMTLGSKFNSKFRNVSVLLTEQINLYLQMEKSPHKKDDLMIANNVLKLATKLLKEIEGPFKMSGLSMNPLLYNITRVVVLSLFSGVMSDLLGFRLKIWKIRA